MKIFAIILVVAFYACSTKEPKYIQGYIYNEYRKPVKGIKIEDPNNNILFSISDDKGYFRINQMRKGTYLYVIKDEKKIDSIYVVRTHPERGMSYSFVEGKNDTVFVNMKKQKIISQ